MPSSPKLSWPTPILCPSIDALKHDANILDDTYRPGVIANDIVQGSIRFH